MKFTCTDAPLPLDRQTDTLRQYTRAIHRIERYKAYHTTPHGAGVIALNAEVINYPMCIK